LQENISSTSDTNLGGDVPVYDMPHLFDDTSIYQSLEYISNPRKFLVSFLNLLNDKTSIQMLQRLLEKCNSGEEIQLEQKKVNHVSRKKIKNREFLLNENIGVFNVGDIILDLGSEVKFFLRKHGNVCGTYIGIFTYSTEIRKPT
jgi:hypothetical protein